MKLDPSHTIYKNHLKMVIDLNARAKTVNFLDRNIGISLYYLGLGKVFLNVTSKAQVKKEKNRLHQN